MAEPHTTPTDGRDSDPGEPDTSDSGSSSLAVQEIESKERPPTRKRSRRGSASAATDASESPSDHAAGRRYDESDAEDDLDQPTGISADAVTQASVEAILLCSERPLSAARIAQVLSEAQASQGQPGESISPKLVRAAIAGLNQAYQATGRSFRIEPLAGGFRVMTLPSFGGLLAIMRGVRQKASLSRAAVETLAIIAYKQPLTRARLEAVRGVACGEVLRSLTERRLITVAGRAEELGRPLLYATTRQFLEVFGLASTKDLPSPEEFARRMSEGFADDESDDSEAPPVQMESSTNPGDPTQDA